MSLERCLELIELRYDRGNDADTLIEELALLEAETLENEETESYHEPLASFLHRADELFSEDELNESLLMAAIANLRQDLEKIKRSEVPHDPLEHLFLDMMRYESGTIPAGTALSTLSRYETLVLALRDHFEHSTDPTDESEIANMMRTGLNILETAGSKLRSDLENESDHAFDTLRDEFSAGTRILREFRNRARFVTMEGEEI